MCIKILILYPHQKTFITLLSISIHFVRLFKKYNSSASICIMWIFTAYFCRCITYIWTKWVSIPKIDLNKLFELKKEHYTLLKNVFRKFWAVLGMFNVSDKNLLGMSRLGFKHTTFCMRGERFNWLHHCSGSMTVRTKFFLIVFL